MSKKAISARGELVDFDLLAIKQQLATTPVPVGVTERRKFIDEKDGIKTREVITPEAQSLPSALNIAIEAVAESAAAEQVVEQTAESSNKKSKSKD
jgi:hypothetical protein